MISPGVFHLLRDAQGRAAHEQRLLSGCDWLLVAAFVQLLAAAYPLLAWIHHLLLGEGLQTGLHPGINLFATIILSVTFGVLWFWARYAPFRAAVAAVIAFILIHGALGFADPRVLLSGTIIKALILVGLLHAVRTGYLRHRPL